MKKLVTLILVVALMCALPILAFATGDAEELMIGEATLQIVKTWEGVEGVELPEEVIINVGEQEVVLTAEDDWQAEVTLDAFAEDGSLMTYAISEEELENYEATIDTENLEMQGYDGLVEGLNKVSSCKSGEIYLDEYNMAVLKKGGEFVIWTEQPLTVGAKAALVSTIEGSGIVDLANLNNPAFVTGYVEFSELGTPITISEDGVITFSGKNAWSWLYRGSIALQSLYTVNVLNTYIPPVAPVEYEWVKTGEDSATGYDPEGKITEKGNWFMYNTVNVAEMAVGESVSFDIQAGQWKNATNFVGAYTLTKTDEGKFVVTYAIKTLDDTHKIQFDAEKLWINGTGEFVTSPGNQKGLADPIISGEEFEFAGDTLYIFAHFDVTYWELVEVEPVVEEEPVEEEPEEIIEELEERIEEPVEEEPVEEEPVEL